MSGMNEVISTTFKLKAAETTVSQYCVSVLDTAPTSAILLASCGTPALRLAIMAAIRSRESRRSKLPARFQSAMCSSLRTLQARWRRRAQAHIRAVKESLVERLRLVQLRAIS